MSFVIELGVAEYSCVLSVLMPGANVGNPHAGVQNEHHSRVHPPRQRCKWGLPPRWQAFPHASGHFPHAHVDFPTLALNRSSFLTAGVVFIDQPASFSPLASLLIIVHLPR